jgi:DNA ligase-associated metallophosphoesterase
VCARLSPSTVVSLGDSFHDAGAMDRMDQEDRAALEALIGAYQWIWIGGNHDPQTPDGLDGVRAKTVRFGALTLRHEPDAGARIGEIAGHLHPAARVAGEARSIRVRCFATDAQRLVMPAFGAYTGGLNLSDPAFTPVFPQGAVALALGVRQLHPIAPDRQVG